MDGLSDLFKYLDPQNNGYIHYKDFIEKMENYLKTDTENDNIKNFIKYLKVDSSDRVYYNDFIDAINLMKYETPTQEIKPYNNESNPFASFDRMMSDQTDNASVKTVDSSLSSDSKYSKFTQAKRNKRLIKSRHNERDTDVTKPYMDSNYLDNDPYYSHKGSHPNLNLDNNRHCSRRQSDYYVTYSNHRNGNTKSHMDESLSCCGGGSCAGGSAANIYYADSMNDIQQKLKQMEQSMDTLQQISSRSKSQIGGRTANQLSKHKSSNSNNHGGDDMNLLCQLQAMEDKLKEQQRQFQLDLEIERDNSRKNQQNIEKLQFTEMESYKERLRAKETELDFLHREITNKNADCERLKYDKLRTEDKLSDLQLQKSHLDNEVKRLKELHHRELDLLRKEQSTMPSLVNNLTNNMHQSQQSEKQLANLRQDNHRLRLQLEETEADLLALSVEKGKSILSSVNQDNSWMNEVDGYTKQEVIDLLVKEKDANFRLREYITGILTRIIEKDPTLLEIS